MRKIILFLLIQTCSLSSWSSNTFTSIDYIRQNKDGRYLLIAKQGDFYGIFGLAGDTILNAEYSYISYEQDSLFFLAKDSLRGIVDIDGKVLLPTIYSSITSFEKQNFYLLKKGNKYGIWDRKTKKITVPPIYDYLKASDGYRSGEKSYATALAYLDTNKQSGLINLSTGEFIFEMGSYDKIVPYDVLECATVLKDNLYTVVDYNKTPITEVSKKNILVLDKGFIFDTDKDQSFYVPRTKDMTKKSNDYDIIIPLNGLLNIVFEDLNGVMDMDGNEIIPPIHNQVYIGDHIIETRDKLDSGNFMIKVFKRDGTLVYQSKSNANLTYDENKNVFVINKEGKEGLLNGKGKEIIPMQYRQVYTDNTSNLIKIETTEGYKMGLANTKGKIIVKPKYNAIDDFVKGVALVGFSENPESYKYGLIDTIGREIITPLFSSVFFNLDDNKMYATIYENHLVGVLSRRDGKVTVPPIYDKIIYQDRTGDNWAQVAIIEKDRKKGLVNISSGELLAVPIYESIAPMGQADSILFCLRNNDGRKVVNRLGKEIIPLTSDFIYSQQTSNNKYLKRLNNEGKQGVVTNKNKNIIPMIYDDITQIYGELFRVKKKDKFGVVNSNNETIVPIEYNVFNSYLYSNNSLTIAKIGNRKGFYDLKKMTFIDSPFYDFLAK